MNRRSISINEIKSRASCSVMIAISWVASLPFLRMWSTQCFPFGGTKPLSARKLTYSMNFVTIQVPEGGYARRGIGGLPWKVATRA